MSIQLGNLMENGMATLIITKQGRCDSRCHEAKAPKCECVCGGYYHGALQAGPEELERRREHAGPDLRENLSTQDAQVTLI